MRRLLVLCSTAAALFTGACRARATQAGALPAGDPPARTNRIVRASRISLCPNAAAEDSLPSYAPGDVTRPADQIQNVAPVYPDEFRARHMHGEAVIAFVINRAGCAEADSRVDVRATHPTFADASWDAIRRMRFRLAEQDGVPVRQRVTLPFEFALLY